MFDNWATSVKSTSAEESPCTLSSAFSTTNADTEFNEIWKASSALNPEALAAAAIEVRTEVAIWLLTSTSLASFFSEAVAFSVTSNGLKVSKSTSLEIPSAS